MSSLLLFDWLDSSGGSTVGGAGCTAWVNAPDCGWRPEDRAMICSCLAAEGERSRCEETDMGLVTGKELCCDWLGPCIVFSPASGLLMGQAWLLGAAAIGWREVGLGDGALCPFGE